MASWWRRIALQVGDGSGRGSWKRRAAIALGAEGAAGSSWPRRIAETVGTEQDVGSWPRRLTPTDAQGPGSWPRRLDASGILYGPRVELSSLSVGEDAEVGDLVALISTSHKPEDWGTSSYSLDSVTDDLLELDEADDTRLEVSAALDFETTPTIEVTITDTPSGPYDPISRQFTINVTNVGIAALLLDDPSQQLYQRDAGGNSFDVPVTGSFTGESGEIEVKILLAADDSTVVDWSTLDAAPSDGAFAGTVTVPEGGPYYAQVRAAAETDIADENTSPFSVGIWILCAGQSNMAGMFSSGSSPPAAAAGTFYHNGSDYAAVPGANGVRELLNGVRTLTGLPVGAITAAVAAVGSSFYLEGAEGFDDFVVPRVTAIGGDIELMCWHQGEGDAAAASPPSSVSYAARLDEIHEDVVSLIGRTRAQCPFITASLATTSVGGSTTDETWNNVNGGHVVAGLTYPNIHYSHTMYDAVRTDGYHYTATSYGKSGARYAQTIAAVLGYETDVAAWHIDAVEINDDTTTDVTLVHSVGTDFTPTSGITGFEVSDDNGANWETATGARVDATTIRLTHPSMDTADDRLVRYLYGRQPDTSAMVFENSTLAVPLTQSAGRLLLADGSVALPVPTYLLASSNASSPDTTHRTWTVNLGTTFTEDTLLIVVYALGGSAALPTDFTMTPDGGSLTPLDEVYHANASSSGFHYYQTVIPANTPGLDAIFFEATFAGNPFATGVLHIWAVPVADLSSTTPVDMQTVRLASGTEIDLAFSTAAGGFFIAMAAGGAWNDGDTDTLTADEPGFVVRGQGSYGNKTRWGDASGTSEADGTNMLYATYLTSAAMRIAAVSWR